MPARFTTLGHQLDKGLDQIKAAEGVKQIEYWETELKDVELSGVKGLLHDMEALKKLLQASEPDSAKIKALLHKIGGETTRVGGRAEDVKAAEKIKEVGEGGRLTLGRAQGGPAALRTLQASQRWKSRAMLASRITLPATP